MHIFYTNKVRWVVLQFLWTGTHLGGKWNQRATRVRHDRTTRNGRPCRCGRPGRCGRPCQVRPHLPCATSPVPITPFPVCTTWMNEIDQGNIGLIEWMKLWSLGSMGPPPRPINCHNCHSKTILSVTGQRRFITRLGVGPAAPRGPAAPPNRHTDRTDPQPPRSKDQERPSREAVDHRADRTPWSGCICENGPTRSTDLTYL
jgi:hypothetical protein